MALLFEKEYKIINGGTGSRITVAQDDEVVGFIRINQFDSDGHLSTNMLCSVEEGKCLSKAILSIVCDMEEGE